MFKIYYTDPVSDQAYSWNEATLVGALGVTENFRKHGMIFVTMVSENRDSIGKPGVDAVADGKLPNGEDYTWKKRRKI